MVIISGFFSDSVVGPLRVPAQIEQWDRNKVNPIGFKQWESGNYRADAKIGLVGGFDAQLESGNALAFGEVNVEDVGFLTETVVLTFNLGEVNSHPDSFFDRMVAASSVDTNFKAFNIKLWEGSLEAFTSVSGLPKPTFLFVNSSGWRRGFQVDPLDAETQILPSSLPPSGNIFKNESDVFISGAYKELEFSDFIYLRGQFPSGSFALGTYGGLGVRTFTFNFSYDWTDINANVLLSDLELCTDIPPISSGVSPPQVSAPLTGLVAAWTMDQSSPRIDLIGKTHLDDINTVTRVSGVSTETAFAAQFTRSNSEHLTSLSISDKSNLEFGDQDFSISLFAFLDDKTQDMPLIGMSDAFGINDRSYLCFYSNAQDRFRFEMSNDGTAVTVLNADSFGSPSVSGWHHIYCEYDSVNNLMGISINNGSLDTISHAGGAFSSVVAPFEIGRSEVGSGVIFHNGRIDVPLVYDQRLTSGEREFLFNSGSGKQIPFGLAGTLASGIQGAYPLNESAGLNRFDRVEGQVHFTEVGTVAVAPGIVGSGLEFSNNASNYLEETTNADLFQILNRDWTIMIRFKIKTDVTQVLISKLLGGGSPQAVWQIPYLASNEIAFAILNTSLSLSAPIATGVTLNVWHTVICEHDSVNNEVAIQMDNGTRVTAAFSSSGANNGNADVRFGQRSDGSFPANAFIDSTYIWHRLLSSAEKTDVFANVSQYPFFDALKIPHP